MSRPGWRKNFRRYLLGSAFLAGLGAWVACGYSHKDYEAPTSPQQGFLVLTTEGGATSLPADGLSQLRLTARISPDSSSRMIDFSTTAGTFVGASGDGKKIETTIDGTGQATVALISDRQPTTALLQAEVKDKPQVAASLSITFGPPDPTRILQFVSAPTSAPADGVSASLFTVQLSPDLPATSREVAFDTTAGSFALGSTTTSTKVTAGGDLRATAILYSPLSLGQAKVTATVFQTSQQAFLTFTPALPDAISVQVDQFQVQNTLKDKVVITAQLLRKIGTVTPGTVVSFDVRDSSGATFGVFGSVQPTNTTGVATATFSPAGSGHLGRATVTVTVPGSSATGKAVFEVVPAS